MPYTFSKGKQKKEFMPYTILTSQKENSGAINVVNNPQLREVPR